MARKNRIKKNRHERAVSAQVYLQTLLERPKDISEELLKATSKQLWNISTRHRIGLPPNYKSRFCRKCKILLYPGRNSRIRIRDKVRHMTCIECGTIKRKNFRG